MFINETKTAYISDGENAFLRDPDYQNTLFKLLDGVRVVKHLKFDGQKESDKCASSAAAIAIEFQKIHKRGLEPTKLHVSQNLLNKIGKYLNKGKTAKLQAWKPIKEVDWVIRCEKCGKGFPKARSKSVLNLHMC